MFLKLLKCEALNVKIVKHVTSFLGKRCVPKSLQKALMGDAKQNLPVGGGASHPVATPSDFRGGGSSLEKAFGRISYLSLQSGLQIALQVKNLGCKMLENLLLQASIFNECTFSGLLTPNKHISRGRHLCAIIRVAKQNKNRL